MSYPANVPEPMTRLALLLSPRLWILVVLGAVCLLGGVAQMALSPRLALVTAGLSLLVLVVAIHVLAWRFRRRESRLHLHVETLIGNDSAPGFTTDEDGVVGYRNAAAAARFGTADGRSLTATLGGVFANPGAVLYRLQSRAASRGAAREDIVTRHGHVRLAVHRIGAGRYLWRMEEMLAKSSAGRGAEAVSLPMLVANKAGAILFVNEALRRIVGCRPKALDRIFPSLPLRNGEETCISSANGPLRTLVAEIEGPGERREIYLLPCADGSSNRDAANLDDLPVALLRLDPGGTVTSANRAARQLLHLTADEADVPMAELMEGLGRPVHDWIADIGAGRIGSKPEILRIVRAEDDAFLQVLPRRVVEAGRPAVLAVLNDATELKTMEAQFVQGQKMQAIGQLAGGVAHDFNNLLTAISGHCDLLLLRHEQADPDYADLVQIHQNANRAASLVGQLLAFSRKQTLKPELIDLREALADLTHLLNRLVGEKVTLCLTHDDALGAIRADKRQLEQVFMNLVVNARDAMPEGGTIWIETEARTLVDELHRDRAVVPPGSYALVRVRDEGAGIAPEKQSKIFEPFFTTKRVGEGTGLGLSTAYGIVKQTGGFIFVDSAPGIGTTFSLYFPVHDISANDAVSSAAGAQRAAAQPATAVRQADAADRSRDTDPSLFIHGKYSEEGVVLLVEDEDPVRAFASRALRLRGYTVLEAESAEEALKTLEDPDLAVDVFVTDVIMPGMDGPSWVREALKTRPNVRVVFVSGYAEESFPDTQARIPNSVYLPKPFSLNDLTMTVQRQLH